MVNKQKLIQKYKLNQLKYEELTPFQRNIIGMNEPEPMVNKNLQEKPHLTLMRKSSEGLPPKEVVMTPRGSNKFQPKTVIRGGNKGSEVEKQPIVQRKKQQTEEVKPVVKNFLKGGKKPLMTARDRPCQELSPALKSNIITLSKKVPVEKIKIGTIKL